MGDIKRQYLRHPTDIPIAFRLGSTVEPCREQLRDVGHGGLCIKSSFRIDPGTRIEIEIPIAVPPFVADGVVVWCHRTKNGAAYQVGVRFEGMETAYAVRMVEQICYIEHYRRDIRRREGREVSSEEAAREWVDRFAAGFPG